MKKLITLLGLILSINLSSQNYYENTYSIYQEYDSIKSEYSNTQFSVNCLVTIDIDNNKIIIGDKNVVEHASFDIKAVKLYSNTTIFRCSMNPTGYICTIKVFNDGNYHIFEVIYTEKNKFRYKQLKE